MKLTLKKILLMPLLLAFAVAPLRAEPTLLAPTQPSAPASPENSSNRVGIDSDGVYLGGPNPIARMGGDAVTTIALAGVLVPFLFIFLIITAFLYMRYRRQRILHETLRLMVEKGVPIPPELLIPQSRAVRRGTSYDLRYGLVLLGLGAGLLILSVRFAWVVLFIGAAFILTWLIERKDPTLNVPPAK